MAPFTAVGPPTVFLTKPCRALRRPLCHLPTTHPPQPPVLRQRPPSGAPWPRLLATMPPALPLTGCGLPAVGLPWPPFGASRLSSRQQTPLPHSHPPPPFYPTRPTSFLHHPHLYVMVYHLYPIYILPHAHPPLVLVHLLIVPTNFSTPSFHVPSNFVGLHSAPPSSSTTHGPPTPPSTPQSIHRFLMAAESCSHQPPYPDCRSTREPPS